MGRGGLLDSDGAAPPLAAASPSPGLADDATAGGSAPAPAAAAAEPAGADGGGGADGACALDVLALDGVFLAAPRRRARVLIPPGGRAELAVACAAPGPYALVTAGAGPSGIGNLFPEGHALLGFDVGREESGAE